MGGGALSGAIIAYRTKNYIYTLLGPFAGYVSGAPGFDVYAPWEMFLVAAFAPVVSYVVYEWTQRKEIDEHKLINLFLGVGTYGLLMVGLLNWGTPQSGYFGLEEGDYAFQHAEMNLLWQVIGIVGLHRRRPRDRVGPRHGPPAHDRPARGRGDDRRRLRRSASGTSSTTCPPSPLERRAAGGARGSRRRARQRR